VNSFLPRNARLPPPPFTPQVPPKPPIAPIPRNNCQAPLAPLFPPPIRALFTPPPPRFPPLPADNPPLPALSPPYCFFCGWLSSPFAVLPFIFGPVILPCFLPLNCASVIGLLSCTRPVTLWCVWNLHPAINIYNHATTPPPPLNASSMKPPDHRCSVFFFLGNTQYVLLFSLLCLMFVSLERWFFSLRCPTPGIFLTLFYFLGGSLVGFQLRRVSSALGCMSFSLRQDDGFLVSYCILSFPF